jgi:hypothetical protein
VKTALRVEKRKWDGSVSTVDAAELLPPIHGAVAWFVQAGAERQHPRKGTVDEVAADEVWAAIPGEWWVLCARIGPDRTIDEYVLHAAAPFQPPNDDAIRWIDLDLDFEVHGDRSALEDETQFHEHARAMAYPDDVIVGAWAGISEIAPRFTTGDWPFDGSLASLVPAHPSVSPHPSV